MDYPLKLARVGHTSLDISTTRPPKSVKSLSMVAARVTATTFQLWNCVKTSARKVSNDTYILSCYYISFCPYTVTTFPFVVLARYILSFKEFLQSS